MIGEEIKDEKIEIMADMNDFLFMDWHFNDWWKSNGHQFPTVDEEHAKSVFYELEDRIKEDIL